MAGQDLSREVQSFIVSEAQMAIDLKMMPFDILGTKAHVIMLAECGIISGDKAALILKALLRIEGELAKGEFSIDPGRGAQLTLEQAVIEYAGEDAGLSMHTARSRNDQVMTAELLYLRDQVLEIVELGLPALEALAELAEGHVKTVMPGYTHMQPGKPTTFAHWCLAYHDAILRGLESLREVYRRYDRCPLGAVESFGTSWPIDRTLTAELLGFEGVWEVPQDAISHRGFFQLEILDALGRIGLDVGKLASDLILFSTFEFSTVGFSDAVAKRLHPVTGSSVMAQKRNPDALELLRAVPAQINGCRQSVFGLLSGLPSGYNRDSREVKEYVELGILKTKAALAVLKKVLDSLEVKKERMEELVRKNYSLTTDFADYLSQSRNLPYRRVYKIVGKAVNRLIKEGRTLDKLTPGELNSAAKSFGVQFNLDEEELQSVLDPASAVENRQHAGGVNSKATMGLCRDRTQPRHTLQDWAAERRDKLSTGFAIIAEVTSQ